MFDRQHKFEQPPTEAELRQLALEDRQYNWQPEQPSNRISGRPHQLSPPLWGGPETGLGAHRRGPNRKSK